jgi:hypothetical protein
MSPRRWLAPIALAFAAAQLLLLDPGRAPSWDEAIYLSQVTPDAEAMHFVASRARGITFLVAVPLRFGASLEAVRIGLAIASAAALAAAHVPWISVVGAAAPLAAAIFGSGWIALFYGSEVMPNLWVALLGVAAIGLVARRTVASGARRDVAIAAALLALAGLVRPFDAVLFAGVAVALALLGRRDPAWSVGALAVGVVAGCLPWAVEVAARYGGIGPAFEHATAVGRLAPTDAADTVVQYLALADGPTIGPVAEPSISLGTAVALPATVALVALALVGSRGRRDRVPLVATTAAAIVFIAVYVLFVGGIAPRFLAPALATLSIAAGASVLELWRRARPVPVRALLLLAFGAWLAWQGTVAWRVGRDASIQRAALERIGVAIRSTSSTTGCAVASAIGYPQVGYPSGCRGRPFPASGSIEETILEESDRRTDTLFLVVTERLADPPAGTVLLRPVDDPATGALFLYRVDLRA